MMRRLAQATLRRARYVTPTIARSTASGLTLNFSTSSHSNDKTRWLGIVPAWALMMVALANREEKSECEEIVYRRSEVEKHKSKESGIWVTFKDGVYDITKFIANHPGGVDKIMLAAGQDIEGFWNVYRQHYNSPLPQELLAGMRIGQLHPDDRVVANASDADESNPYRKDPVLSPVMRYISRQPINAEAPRFLLTDSWVTPTELWFVRNHHPVPQIEDINYFRVDLVFAADLNNERDRGQEKATDGSSSPLLSLTLQDLKTKFPKTIVTTSIQCGGNRRQEMTQVERTNGANWDVSAISTARFGGVRLRDVLASVGITEESLFHDGRADQKPVIQHVHFVGLDAMEASIPVKKALSRFGDVLLAYEMNDEELTPKHGYPLRAVIPGHAGVRNVKWVTKIRLSSEEAQGPWQRGMAYKGFGPSLRSLEGIDVEAIPSLQEQPVTSAITVPATSSVEAGEPLTVKGYAYSGGGRGIVRVDVSIDGGKTWKTATLTEGKDQPLDRAWAWTLWECDFDIPESMQSQSLRIISKATDAAYNVQPDSIEGVWNLRGINNNAWHRVNVEVVAPAVEDEEDE